MFIELVAQLPSDSAYKTAITDDDELLAQEIDAHGEPTPSRNPPLAGWSATQADLADIKDLLKAIALRGSDRPLVPTPRPETAYTRYKRAKKRANTRALYEALGCADVLDDD